MKVYIKHFTEETYETHDSVQVFVDDELIGTGYYGGEPEDNSFGRDYSWVEPLIKKLVTKLGIEVEQTFEEITEE